MDKILKCLKNIKKEFLFNMLLLLPFFLLIITKISVSLLGDLSAYYKIIDITLMFATSVFISLVYGIKILDDNNYNWAVKAYGLTVVYTFLMFLLLSFSDAGWVKLLLTSIINGFTTIFIIIFTTYFCINKEHYLKLISLSSILVLSGIVPFLTWNVKQFYLAFLPTYWIGKFFNGGYLPYAIWSVVISIIWIAVFKIVYNLKSKL